MEPSWPPQLPAGLRTLLTLLSPLRATVPAMTWAQGVFPSAPCPAYLLLLRTRQGGVASSVEPARPRQGHAFLPPSSRIVIVRKSFSARLTLACSQHCLPGENAPSPPWGPSPCPPPPTVPYAAFLVLFPRSLPLRTLPLRTHAGSPGFSLVNLRSPQGHRCAQSVRSLELPSRKEVTQEWQPPWKARQHSRCCHTSPPAGVPNPPAVVWSLACSEPGYIHSRR